jgi:hypothetical protein
MLSVFRRELFSRDAKALRSGARTSRIVRVGQFALRSEYSASRLNAVYAVRARATLLCAGPNLLSLAPYCEPAKFLQPI